MVCILASILSLTQHLSTLKNNPENYYLECCPQLDCGKSGLWRHGYRYRKADREEEQTTLNPIPIQRLYCPTCKRTCSILPECIPPKGWYLWVIQQAAMQLFLSGMSLNKISQQIKPSRWIISRWIKRFQEKFHEHALHLKTKWSWLGYCISFQDFWSALLNKISLSHVMLFLNNQGIFVP
jgi:transposase-like protein